MEKRRNPNVARVTLDPEGCISLARVLQSFTAGVNEEQAWALCYQIVKTGQGVLLSTPQDRDNCLLVTETQHVKLHQDGSVHKNTFLMKGQGSGPPRAHCSDECKIISKLVTVVYEALEYGMEDDAERVLSPELEDFLEKMIYADESDDRPETDDEGIECERDSGDSDDDRMHHRRAFNFLALLKICRLRLGSSPTGSSGPAGSMALGGSSSAASSSVADNHYKNVVRALVAETLELSTFLEKVAQGTNVLRPPGASRCTTDGRLTPDENPGLAGLHFTDWARLWVQVIRDLRNGVKLKKVDCFDSLLGHGPPIEYELTPYEILMDDIRSRRYKLKHVMVDGELPQRVKRDAHELILDFIRGRPPLKKASDRVLPPVQKKELPPIEALLESIRSKDPQSLKPTKTIVKSSIRRDRASSGGHSTSLMRSSSVSTPSISSQTKKVPDPKGEHPTTPQRRLIKVDLDALYGDDKGDDSDNENDRVQLKVVQNNDGSTRNFPDHTQSEPVTPSHCADPPIGTNSRLRDRRHTISNTQDSDHAITFPLEYTNNPMNAFQSLNGPSMSAELAHRKQTLPRSMSKSLLQEEFFQSNQWQTAMGCLTLNLDEVVHIRNVLTKAELESLPLDCNTKGDVESGKVCFLCLKAKFSLFGPWAHGCKLCKRMVCSKCCSKMRIPMEHFSKIPVSSLSPMMSPTREEDCSIISTDGELSERVSASPERETETLDNSYSSQSEGNSGRYSFTSVSSISMSLQALKRRSFTPTKDSSNSMPSRISSQLMVVCHDCKVMVLQVIRYARASKKGKDANFPLHSLP